MVTRAATSGKWKFVPDIGQQCHTSLGGQMPRLERPREYLHAVKVFRGRFGARLRGSRRARYFFSVEARKSTVRFHASVASAGR